MKRRREIAAKYHDAFGRHPLLMDHPQPAAHDSSEETLNTVPHTISAWHLYILRLRGEKPNRRRVVESLREKGIGTQVHYLPVYLHPYYRKLGYRPGLCPRAEDYYRRAFSIPIFLAMTDAEVERVIKGVLCAVENPCL